MRTAPRRTFTRAELATALEAIDRPDLTEGIYSRPLDSDDGGGASLAFDYDTPSDLGLFLVTVATLAGDDGGDFAAAMRLGIPGHPGRTIGGMGAAWWPRWALDEPTVEQWWDTLTRCPVCDVADLEGPCEAHKVAPWDVDPYVVGRRELVAVP